MTVHYNYLLRASLLFPVIITVIAKGYLHNFLFGFRERNIFCLQLYKLVAFYLLFRVHTWRP